MRKTKVECESCGKPFYTSGDIMLCDDCLKAGYEPQDLDEGDEDRV